MPRIRSLKPEFATSEAIAALDKVVRLHFAMLWTYADDEGRGVDNSRLIKAALWPLDDDVGHDEVEAWQQQLADHGRILRYEVDGRRYFEVRNWHDHQHPQKPKESQLPPPSDTGTRHVPDADEPSPVALLPVGEGRGEVVGGDMAPRAARQDDLWDAVMAGCNIDVASIPQSARGAYNRAVGDLRKVGATPGEVRDRCAGFRMRWPNASLTPTALARRWAECAEQAAMTPRVNGNQAALARASVRGAR